MIDRYPSRLLATLTSINTTILELMIRPNYQHLAFKQLSIFNKIMLQKPLHTGKSKHTRNMKTYEWRIAQWRKGAITDLWYQAITTEKQLNNLTFITE